MDEAANNIVPLNGSPLSRRSRENISANITSFNSFISEQKNFNSQKTRADDYQNVLIQGGQTSITSLQEQLDGISKELATLSLNVNRISLSVQEQGTAEQLRLKSEQENQKRLAEKRVAIGRENELEQRIQSSLTSPIITVQAKVSDLFGRVEQAFTTLFLGWLSSSIIDYLKAQSEGDTDKLNQIKSKILSGLVVGIGSLVAVKTGLSLVGRSISAVTSGVASLIAKLATAPFRGLGAGIRNFGGGKKPPTPGTKPGKGFGSGVGKFVTFLSTLMNYRSGEIIDGILGSLALASRAPGALGAIGKIAGIAFTADEIAEAFGKNIFGDDRDKKVQEIAQNVKQQESKSKPAGAPVSTPKIDSRSSKPAPVGSVTTPTGTNQENKKPENITPSQAQVAPSTKMAPQASNLTMNVTPPRSQPSMMGQSTVDKNVDTESTPPQAPSQEFPNYASVFMKPGSNEMKISENVKPPAQISPPPKDTKTVGSLPEVKPNVIVATDTNTNNTRTGQPAAKTPPANPDVPYITSSNPDNFYILYSQLNYNIVI